MDLFNRVKNIIKSNINHKEQEIDIDINSYQDIYFDDSKEIVYSKENELEKKYYKILEVEYGADFKQIKSGYRKLLKKYHPDMFINEPEKFQTAQVLIKQINEAYTYFERKFI